MKLGIIMPPKPESFDRAKELGLDFVEFDLNPGEFFGMPKWDLADRREELKAQKHGGGDQDAHQHSFLPLLHTAVRPCSNEEAQDHSGQNDNGKQSVDNKLLHRKNSSLRLLNYLFVRL